MTIEKGRDWARPMTDDVDRVWVDDDAEVAALVAERLVGGGDRPVVTPRSGDLLRTVGLSQPRVEGAMRFDADLVMVEVDEERTLPFVAHLLVHQGLRRSALMAMNAPLRGPYRLGPRAHPNDGLLDVVSGRVPWPEVPEFLRRARGGNHLPHPGLSVQRRAACDVDLGAPGPLVVDGRRRGRARRLSFRVVPDAFMFIA